MKIIVIAGIVFILLLLAAVLILLSPHLYLPKQKDFADKLDPRIHEKAAVPALTVEFDGDPDIVISAAYKSLFKAYYRLKGAPKGPGQPAPLARYRNFSAESIGTVSEAELKARDWQGFVAIPLASTVDTLPESGNIDYPVRVEQLEYGTVAEIIHLGPYDEEHAAIRRLLGYIDEQGYRVVGLHEEEYLRGPGVPLVRPESYITVIRYRVERK